MNKGYHVSGIKTSRHGFENWILWIDAFGGGGRWFRASKKGEIPVFFLAVRGWEEKVSVFRRFCMVGDFLGIAASWLMLWFDSGIVRIFPGQTNGIWFEEEDIVIIVRRPLSLGF